MSPIAIVSPASPQARLSYLGISLYIRRQRISLPSTSTCTRSSSGGGTYRRSDFTNQPFTGIYEPGGPTEGPLRDASTPPPITPTALKHHLDAFVVGQDRAKRVLSTAVYNHYQRINELQHREDEDLAMREQEERRRTVTWPRHPVEGRSVFEEDELGGRAGEAIRVPSLTTAGEDEFPGQAQTTSTASAKGGSEGMGWTAVPMDHQVRARGSSAGGQQHYQYHPPGQTPPLFDPTPLTIEKSNILLLGPSGVGKTLMAKTLARVLEVPFSMSDCTPFTQAGYIGEDAEVCVQRLLAAANYDVARAERGIICLDELDKIATAKVSHGKDVSGEGVQQALLKIIEGTTLQIQAKSERSAGPPPSGRSGAQQGYPPGGSPTNSPLSSGTNGQQSATGGQKGETYNVRTDNILFICAGAFNGLHKIILDRVSKGSIGFGAIVRARPGSTNSSPNPDSTEDEETNLHETLLTGEEDLFAKHLPYYQPPADPTSPTSTPKQQQQANNILNLLTPRDLQSYGLLPELTGRLPITCPLSPLSTAQLVDVLTTPRNALLKQYISLFALSGIELRFTTPALHAVARKAARMGTGARGLRGVMEGVLGEVMFAAPGSGVRGVVVGRTAAEGKEGVRWFWRGEENSLESFYRGEEEEWVRERDGGEGRVGGVGSFEEFRERERVGVAGGAS